MALTKTVQYYLARFGLTLSHRGVVDGATYTDVKAQLPALNLLMLISVAAAILFIANIWRRGWVFPIIAVGLWGFISIVVGTIYPAVIQRFVVQPNEFAKEQTVHQAQHRRRRAPRSGSTRSRPGLRLQRRPHRAAGRRQQDDARQRAAVGPRPAHAGVAVDRGVPALLPVHRRRRRPLRRERHVTQTLTRSASSTRPSFRAAPGRTSTSCTPTVTASTPRRATATTATNRATC